MAQFDVYRNPIDELRDAQPYVMQLQSGHLRGPVACLTIPLVRAQAGVTPMARLNPAMQVEGVTLLLDTLFLTSFEPSDLRRPVANLAQEADAIWVALDYALHGY